MPSPAEGPRRSRQGRSGPAGAAEASKTGVVGRARGAGPGPGGTWFVRDPGTGSRTGTVGRGPRDRPTGGGGRAPIRPEENFATALYFLMEWCVKSPRTDGVADDRTRWPKHRWGGGRPNARRFARRYPKKIINRRIFRCGYDPSLPPFSPSQPSREAMELRATSTLTFSAILIFTLVSPMSTMVP